jgi:hypothetical protein
MIERMVGIELEDEDGKIHYFRVKRIVTQDPDNRDAVFSNELIFRPGGGAIARRVDNRALTLADDAIADAHQRQQDEVEAMRQRSLTTARTGGEHSIQPAGEQVGDDGDSAPGKRPRRGSRATEAETPAA